METPLVSIIIPCYNAQQWISECLESAIAQTYKPLEIIVIDDGSTDESLQVIQRYTEQYPDLIRYESGPNRGGCVARNRGLTLSRGDYVMFLDADDVISDGAIEEHIKVQLSDGSQFHPSVTSWKRVKDLAPGWVEIPGTGPQCEIGRNDLDNIFRFGCYPVHSIVYPQTLLSRVGAWDETLARGQDVDLLVRCLIACDRVLPIPEVMAFYRFHAGHINGTSTSAIYGEDAAEALSLTASKFEELFRNAGKLEQYKSHLGKLYLLAATSYFSLGNNDIGNRLTKRAFKLGGYRVIDGTFANRLSILLFGVRRKEKLAQLLARYGIGRGTRLASRRKVNPT